MILSLLVLLTGTFLTNTVAIFPTYVDIFYHGHIFLVDVFTIGIFSVAVFSVDVIS